MRINAVELENTVAWLRNVIKATEDKRLIGSFAEYLVAHELAKRGHNIDVLQKKLPPDLHVIDIDKRIEVKSSHTDMEGWTCGASFKKGASIKRSSFDYCVFVPFRNLVEPTEYLVFRIDDLKEVALKPRGYPITAYPNNPCVLFRYSSLQEYEKEFPNKEDRLNIEVKLHKHPEQFRDRWDKIV